MKKAVYIFGVVFALLVCVCFIRFFIDNSLSGYEFKENVSLPSNTALERFSGGLKIKTVSNPEYSKTDFSKFSDFISYLQKTYPEIFNKCDFQLINNYAIVLKLKGQNSANPNLMTAHYDVVGVKNENDWSYKPFSGFYDNEYIYSRGTIDDKGSVFAILEALNELIISGFVPQNDLYIAFSHCEETGSIEGAPKVIEYFKKNNIKFNTALDEGGRIAKKNSNYFAFVGTKEKGRLLTKITVYGKGSHASTPYQNSAVKKLAKLIFAFEKNQENARILPEIKKYYKTTYKSYSTIDKFLISNMDILKPLFIYKMSKNNEENARLASTAAITIIEASNVQNAVSNEASMLVDIRILPDKSTDDIKKYVNKIIKQTLLDKDIKVEYLSIMEPCVSKNANDDEFQKLAQIIRKIYPNIPVSPYLTLGATDAREYSEISDNTYRFLPCILKPEEYALMHSDNEKISIKNWGRMIDFYKEYILNK